MTDLDALKWVYSMALHDFEEADGPKWDEQRTALWMVYQLVKLPDCTDPAKQIIEASEL